MLRRTVRCEPTVAKQHLFVESPSHTFASPTMCLCCSTISTGEMGIVETFGKFDHIAAPGLTCFAFPCQQLVGRLSTRVQQLNVSTDTKTKDNVTVTVRIAVQYRVINEMVRDRRGSLQTDGASKPLLQSNGESASASDMDRDMAGSELFNHGVCRAYYRLTDIVMQLTPYVEDVVRSEVPKRTLDEAYESKEAVALAVKSALSIEMQRCESSCCPPSPLCLLFTSLCDSLNSSARIAC